MDGTEEAARASINRLRGCLVATIQVDLDVRVLKRLNDDLLGTLDATRLRQVILDCSGIEVMDAEDFVSLRRIIDMASLMGTRTVLAGLRPGVVSALIDFDVDPEGLRTALNLDDALAMLESDNEPDEELRRTEGDDDTTILSSR